MHESALCVLELEDRPVKPHEVAKLGLEMDVLGT